MERVVQVSSRRAAIVTRRAAYGGHLGESSLNVDHVRDWGTRASAEFQQATGHLQSSSVAA